MKKGNKQKSLLRFKMKKFFFLTLFAFAKYATLCQTVISTGGNQVTKSTYTLNYTIGETGAITLQNANYSLSQGFQQTQLKVVAIEDFIGMEQWKVFPNPVYQVLNIEQTHSETYTIYILDIEGRILRNLELQSNVEQLDFQEYKSGMYFLNIISKANNQKASFKIIKQ